MHKGFPDQSSSGDRQCRKSHDHGFSTAPTEVNQFAITSKELDVRGSRLQNKMFGKAIEMINAGTLDLSNSISHTFPLTKAQEAFDFVDSRDPSIRKIVFTFDNL